MRPKISIITATFNSGSVIEPTIKSVTGQSFQDLEYIIIDGQSSDNTMEVIKHYEENIDLVISESDKGVYDAMNKGIKRANGEYLLFLNSGDELSDPHTLQHVFNLEEADIYFGETNILNLQREFVGTRSQITSRKLPETLTKKHFLHGQIVSHQSFIVRKSQCSNFNLRYSCSSDIDWMLTAVENANGIHNVGMSISNYLQGGISDRNLLTCWMERFLIMMKHFDMLSVIWAHVKFAFRFVYFGRYRTTSKN